MDEKLKSNLTSSKHWLRLVYMILFALFLQVAAFVMWVVVGLQFLFSLITGVDNDHLRRFGASLTAYIRQALLFLTYNSEEKPFPFADWPASDSSEVDADRHTSPVSPTSGDVVAPRQERDAVSGEKLPPNFSRSGEVSTNPAVEIEPEDTQADAPVSVGPLVAENDKDR